MTEANQVPPADEGPVQRPVGRPAPERAAFERWAAQRWGGHAYRHTSATSGEWEAWQSAVAAERERCAQIVSAYRVPVGNSPAGEMAAERTMDALREIRDAIRGAERAPEVGPRKCSRPQCNGDMLPGVAVQQTYTGTADFPGHEAVTMSPGGQGALVPCLKCNVCGHSVSA